MTVLRQGLVNINDKFSPTLKTFLKTLENISMLFNLPESADIENLGLSWVLLI